jgi:3-hydroxyacyl-CoA dehydrogenase/enoyl-CoA hydratase/3-hydroxybutyryl-CoA epimerase
MLLRKLETCGKPVAAAINGTALGGGFEICLASHYRVVADDPKIQLGLPEAKVGVMPGGGGTQRLPRLIGAMQALPLMLQGKTLGPQAALGLGLVHKVVPKDQVVAEARRWLLEEGKTKTKQPWDESGYKIPGGGPYTPQGLPVFMMGSAMLRKESYGNYPAQKAIMQAVYEGLQVPIDAGLRIESRFFTGLLLHPTARNMIRSLFLSMQELEKGARRPAGEPPTEVKRLGVLGAGMMGAGVAYVSAGAGIEVVLLDTDLANAERGKQHSAELMDKRILKGRATSKERQELLDRIHPTVDFADLASCDLVIEAVFEDRKIKADVTRKAEAVLGADAIFGSNTSTLPITGLAEASVRPDSFVGIHFFSPVDRMQLVELIVGKKTSPRAVATALDYVKKIRKVPIVVDDSRGFYTSRCFGTYVGEGILMLAEGIAPPLIENAGRATGMPRAPLEMNDDVALDLGYKVRQQTKKDLGAAYVETPADRILEKMVVELQRYGRKNKKGFYEYPDGGKKVLWAGLRDLVREVTGKAPVEEPPVEELEKRLLYIQALEAARCFEERVVTDVRDADVGAILGWGFAPWTGGPLSLIDTVGTKRFVAECDELARRHGKRFEPNELLREMAERDETFYRRFAPQREQAA